jgi:hypothetical protein
MRNGSYKRNLGHDEESQREFLKDPDRDVIPKIDAAVFDCHRIDCSAQLDLVQ